MINMFEKIKITRKDEEKVARAFSDYEITIDKENFPENVQLIEMA